MINTVEILIQGHQLILLPQKAVYWPEQQMIIIADAHLGKSHHFRKSGIAIPLLAADENYTRLNLMFEEYHPKTCLFLGDLFHSRQNSDWINFCLWRKEYPGTRFILIRGNHDIFKAEEYEKAKLEVFENELEINNFHFRHDPLEKHYNTKYVIAGHIHPRIKMRGSGNQNIAMPAFIFGEENGLMPSFGVFTGGTLIYPKPADLVYGVWNKKIINVKASE